MQREEYTIENWCSLWFQNNQYKWNPNTKGGKGGRGAAFEICGAETKKKQSREITLKLLGGMYLKMNHWPKRDPIKNYFPLPNEIFSLKQNVSVSPLC